MAFSSEPPSYDCPSAGEDANDIAVVGFSFKLPQNIDNVSSFWDVLQNRRSVMTTWPKDRLNPESFVTGKRTKFDCQGGYFINEDLAAFDAPFFSISTKDAAALDPMQRWTLEASYHAFENSGIPAEKLKGTRTSVFSASFTDDWSRMVSQDPENAERSTGMGVSNSLIANRVSWYFDLKGPSIHVDTACSSSLCAVDMACQSIRAGESTAALVTGSNVILTPAFTHFLSDAGFLSPDSRCWAFDHRGNGYARGEGFVAIFLKPLRAALQDGDMIRSVIRSSGSNQDGKTPSITQPNPRAQEELIRHVYQKANLSMEQTRYVEAHGTGTALGDPIELKAIGSVFRGFRSATQPLYVGSIKTNVGHLEGASGLAGVVKAIVSLEKGIIPPQALYEKPNPEIDFEIYNVAIPTEQIPWPCEGLRRVSVNSFGFGGTNTHVIMDDAYHYLRERALEGYSCTLTSTGGSSVLQRSIKSNDQANAQEDSQTNENTVVTGSIFKPKYRLLVWSALDEKAVRRNIEQYQAYYASHIAGNSVKLDQLAYTLATRRSRMQWRTFGIVADSVDGQPGSLAPGRPMRSSDEVGLALVFTGQGAQYAGMGLELTHQYPLFSETLRQIADIYEGFGCTWNLFDELRIGKNINLPEYSQPLSTAVQIALVELLRGFNVLPKAVIGHSSGEIAAAYAIGALSLESACKVSYFRGQLAGKLRAAHNSPGAMISINLAEHEIPAHVERAGAAGVSIACINSPSNCTLSGPEDAIDAVKMLADEESLLAQKLAVGIAYHSPAMLVIADEYKTQMGKLEAASRSFRMTMISTVTAKIVRPNILATAQYWVDNMVSPVQFTRALQLLTQNSSMLSSGLLGVVTDIVEIGPTAALRRPVVDTLAMSGPKAKDIRYSSALHRKRSSLETMLDLAGHLFALGHSISITEVNQLDERQPFLVDCPEYRFDHTNKYWTESRISRDYRLRGAVKGEMLGVRASDWNPLRPRWRNFLSVESDPWLADHNVSNTVVYPAAGMMIIAMEAAMQGAPAYRTVSGYTIKEARFMSPIVVGETWGERTETVVELRPLQKTYEKYSTWSEVCVFCYRKNQWTECFWARVQIHFEEDDSQAGAKKEKKLLSETILRHYEQVAELCTRPVDTQVFYRNAAEYGLRYGEWFQLLDNLRWDGKRSAVAQINVNKSQLSTTSLVHPSVLDNVLQMLRASSQGLASASATNVPSSLTDAYFSAKGWKSTDTTSIRCWGLSDTEQGGGEQSSGEQGSIYAISDDGTILMALKHVVTIGVAREDDKSVASAKRLLHKVQWKPQMSLLEPHELKKACISSRAVKDEAVALIHHNEMRDIMNYVLSKTLRDMTPAERAQVPSTVDRHMAWIEYHVANLGEGYSPNALSSDEDLEHRLQGIEARRPSWKLHTRVVRELKNILLGLKDPLEIIFEGDLANNFYAEMFAQICDVRLYNYLELASHENPGLRILEKLENDIGGLRLAEYTYTDISPMFFERAREQWKGLESRISFKVLDLEQTLGSQGIELGSYDIVVAGSVLHATTEMAKTMKNVRTALKSGGQLLMLEVIATEDVVVNFSFGLVPGWWLAREEWRRLSPLLTEDQWDTSLRNVGFSGNDLVLRDYEEGGCHICSIIVSTSIAVQAATAASSFKLKILIIINEESQEQVRLAEMIDEYLLGSIKDGKDVIQFLSLQAFHETKPQTEDIVICLASLDAPFFHNMTGNKLSWLQHLIRHTKKLLWVSAPVTGSPDLPFHYQSRGFFSSLRLEAADSQIVTLTIEIDDTSRLADYAKHVNMVLQTSFIKHSSKELEYIVRGGLIETCRVAEDIGGNVAVNSLLFPHQQLKPWSDNPPLALSFKTAGTLDSLCYVEDIDYGRELGENEVEMEAKAWGVTFRDVLQALGRQGERDLGYDCAGVVTRAGRDVQSSFKVGDRVCAIRPGGAMRRHVRAPAQTVAKIPRDDMTFAEAAAMVVPGVTAHLCMVDIARIAKGESVLIHSGAGSTGQMSIRVAQKRGAVVYATVSSEDKKRFLVDVLGVPEENIFQSRNTSFAQGVMRVTKGRGVDVVLNSLSGDGLRASWECMSRCGRFIEIGKAGIESNSGLPMANFARNVTFSAVDLREIISEDPDYAGVLLQHAMDMACDGDMPKPIHTFAASRAEEAFLTLQNGEAFGRVIIEPGTDHNVPQYLRETRSWKFDDNASYLIAGGFGGIGRAIMKWIVDRGGRYIIVLSRSGALSKAASDTIADLKSRGARIFAPKCDVASESALSNVIQQCASTLPPIKGCIDAALVLQDAMFDNMTLTQWKLAVTAKVDTAWNLHRLLPTDLDFFVLLSSLAGTIGQMSTANYASGCTFQDALAHHRLERGLKAVSINLGWMRDIGIVAETAAFQRQRLITEDMQQVSGAELMALLTQICDPEAPLRTPEQSQILLGLRTPADFLAKGQIVPALLDRPLFAAFSRIAGTQITNLDQAASSASLFRAAASANERADIVVTALVAKLARVMSILPADVEHSKPLSNYGVDSLMAVELCNWIRRDFSAPIAVFDIMAGVPISAIGELVVARSALQTK